MKTTIKITALAIITVLALLACTPEIEMTQRDFTEIRDGKNPKYDNIYSNSHVPYIDSNKIYYRIPPLTLAEKDKELDIYFPDNADILDKEITTAALKAFLSIYTFTTDKSNPLETKASVKETDINFEYVRRVKYGNGNGTNIYSNGICEVVIKLETVPNKPFVVKIDATKYTFANGLKLDTNNNGITGEAIYDDIYKEIQPNGAASSPSFIGQTIDIKLNIVAELTNNTNPMAAQDITIATLEIDNYYSSANLKKQNKDVIEALMSKIKLQKYNPDKKTWDTTGTVKAVDSNPSDTVNGNWSLAVNVSPQAGDIYRAYATDMNNLTTTIDFLGIKQKIRVSGGYIYNQSYYKYTYKTVISTPLQLSGSTVIIPETLLPIRDYLVSSDATGKNVKLEIYFNSIPSNNGVRWLKKLDTATFKKNVKLVYNPNSPSSSINLSTSTKLDALVFIPIKDVSYDDKDRFGSTTTPGMNRITITLDPSYQLSQNKDRAITFLLAPGFQYDDPSIVFGDISSDGLTIFIDGVNCWESYTSNIKL